MRKLLMTVVFALVVAACGGDAEPVSSVAPSSSADTTEGAPSSTAESSPTETSTEPSAETAAPSESTEASGPSFDGPPAPTFELALSDGPTFRLSDEEKPVYMVFWAEW